MDHFSFLIIVLTLSQSSLGSIIPTSQSVGNSDGLEGSGNTDAQMTTGFASITEINPSIAEDNSRNLQKPSSIPASLTSLPVPQKLTDDDSNPQEPEKSNKEIQARMGIIAATTPALSLPLLEAHEQEADKYEPLIIETSGHFHTNEHLEQAAKDILSEETLFEVSQITVDGHLDENHTPIVFDNFLPGKSTSNS